MRDNRLNLVICVFMVILISCSSNPPNVGKTPIVFVTVKPQSTADNVARNDQNTQNSSVVSKTSDNITVITPSNSPITPATTPKVISASKTIIEKSSLTKSIGNSEIDLYRVGYAEKNEYAIFVVGQIAGEQTDTKYAVIDIYEKFKKLSRPSTQ